MTSQQFFHENGQMVTDLIIGFGALTMNPENPPKVELECIFLHFGNETHHFQIVKKHLKGQTNNRTNLIVFNFIFRTQS